MSESHSVSKPVATGNKSPLRHIRYEHLVAGVSGGVSATLCLHPLDLVKIRLQVNDGGGRGPLYKGFIDATRSVIKNDGWRGLYQGAAPNVTGNGMAWGLYFFSYNIIKAWMQDDSDQPLGADRHLLAGAVAGLATLTVTNPVWVVKTRMCLQYSGPHVTTTQTHKYTGMIDAFLKIWRYEGISGLYKGYLPGVIGVSHGALQFMAYEELKKRRSRYFNQPVNQKLNSYEYLIMASISKIFAASATYPYQVVRSRLQNHNTIGQYNGAIDIIRKIIRFEGIKGFYKGLLPSIIRVTPACAITFVVYENVVHYLLPKNNTD
ncbi:mitochondrial folate transporter/carrier [Exaiptasia diaphana]|uniref:Solute carrier family 25 member 32 n=1 Tax=Exaiptasia diaphana TaxID=2652724 RepID=A0A913WXD5_EXADI|nr:mitochondrial folate transporter/carrier [Exaiptasia diaphana]KXJ27628.1 Mitochondrial folate transporter/carrier [Exaiptasia diaphana]